MSGVIGVWLIFTVTCILIVATITSGIMVGDPLKKSTKNLHKFFKFLSDQTENFEKNVRENAFTIFPQLPISKTSPGYSPTPKGHSIRCFARLLGSVEYFSRSNQKTTEIFRSMGFLLKNLIIYGHKWRS